MTTLTTSRILLFFGLYFIQNILLGQEQEVLREKQPVTFFNEKIAPLIEARLRQPDGDTAHFYLLEKIRSECKNEVECLRSTFNAALEMLEKQGKYRAAIPLAEALVSLAQSGKNLQAEVEALEKLVRLYNFSENIARVIWYREELIRLYERTGDREGAINTKALILEGKAWQLGESDKAISGLEALLEEAIEHNLTKSVNSLRIRLKYLYEEFGHFEKLEGIVEALEKMPYSDPLQPSETFYAFHAACGRADLLMREKKFDEAASLYLRALDLSRLRHRKHHDVWSEIYILLRLGALETERRHFTQAHAYLDEAFEKAEKLNMNDHLEVNFKRKAQLAEAERNYADALHFTRKFYEYRDRVDSLSPHFDMKKYFLEMEAEQLKLEKERQALALQLKTSQLNYSVIVVTLAILLATGLFFGLYKQRQGKRKIAAQFDLIQEQAEQLKQLDAAKSRFFANVSHELRTPLTLMLGPIKTLQKGNLSPEQQEKLLNMVQRNGRQLQILVNEILDLQKMEMGKMELNLSPVGLASFFYRHASQFESLAINKGIDFFYETNITGDVSGLVDREKCRQILSNLLSNAFKFTPPGGQVKVELEMVKSENPVTGKKTAATGTNSPIYQLQLTVSDTGTGIYPNDLPHVFDRFYQTSRTDATVQGGTGIGLALCHEYVQLFGGKIAVESRLGEGSTFRAAFPVTLTESTAEADFKSVPVFQPPATPENAVSAKPAADTRPIILVVEDNPELQAYIRFILAEKYHVITAGNGKEALEQIRDEEQGMRNENPAPLIPHPSSLIPDLILSDLMMPVMDGYQFLEKLKGDDATRHIPVIMLTARAEAKDRLKALRIGVDDYLTKPFDEEELLVRIENLLANQAARKLASAEEHPAVEAPDMSQPDQEWLENFEAYIQDHLSNDALTISFLAQEFAMSESTLLRQVTRLTGLTPKQYLQEVRLDAARQLLENRAYRTVSRVAAEAGYSNARSFSRQFKERFGKSPSEYLND